MLIKIPLGSNKSPKAPNFDDIPSPSSVSQPKLITASNPFIDKLTLIVKPHTKGDALAMHKGICSAFDQPEFQTAKTNTMGFQVSKWLNISGFEQDSPRFSYRFSGNEAVRLRLEFNPTHLGASGLTELKSWVGTMMEGWEYALKNGHLTRVDIAIDVQGVTMSDFLTFPTNLSWMREFGRGSNLETLTFGTGKTNRSIIYDKGNERVAKGHIWNDPPTVRIERRMNKLNGLPISALYDMDDPFPAVTISTRCGPPPGVEQRKWDMFMDSCQVRGVQGALMLLEAGTARPKYKKQLAANPPGWWSLSSNWSGWAAYLDGSELLLP
ncbi:hypothetical protein [Devosia psychrophila]|uniref:Uncharacterized protein n=1 Tax=Devosia psychrophila TaxID=728005 RepID=A0A0F5PVK7_9HYPH|nr:hypothetical protein [Devosia psychrophila]KKC32653.1 hypothetical protein WH91_12540 [Devosia psychrophila]SFC51215.1 hypothetical protein SAMN04488059_10663 [Devosia psychrophila]